MYIYLSIYLSIYIYIYIYTCVYIYIYICVCIYIYIYIHIGPADGDRRHHRLPEQAQRDLHCEAGELVIIIVIMITLIMM